MTEAVRDGGRSPCGERGLKLIVLHRPCTSGASLPVRGAWIEIMLFPPVVVTTTSLPVRGAWIEIVIVERHQGTLCVAPRAGSVD